MSRCRSIMFFSVIASAMVMSQALAQSPQPIHLNYAFDHWRQSLDLYLPDDGCGPHALAIYIHGGGWIVGDSSHVTPYVEPLIRRRMAVASINYRWSSHAPFPAQIHDCKAAVRFLRAHAQVYDLDPERFAAFGDSSGGHLAALLGTSAGVTAMEGDVGDDTEFSSEVQVVADLSGPTDMFELGSIPPHNAPDSIVSRLFDWPIQDIIANQDNPDPPYPDLVALIHAANPSTHASSDDPPFRIVHGELDDFIPPTQSTQLHDALLAAGAASTLDLVSRADHSLPWSAYPPVFSHFVQTLNIRLSDINCDAVVGVADLLAVINAWGPCPSAEPCPADVNIDAMVGVADLLAVINDWG